MAKKPTKRPAKPRTKATETANVETAALMASSPLGGTPVDLGEATAARSVDSERRIVAAVMQGSPSRIQPVGCQPVAN